MRLNEMLSNYINQNSVSVKSAGSAELQQLSNHIASQIKTLTPGQILQGEVMEYLGDSVKLLVNMNGENITLQARMDQNMMLAIGKSLLFQVKNNGSSLALSPLFENMGMEQNAAKALETASLPVNETTMGMTAKLMQEGISIDKNTLQEIYHEVLSNQNAELMDIIDLHKLNLPVTNENLTQLHSYKAMTHQLVGGVEQMSQDLIQLLQNMSENGQGKDIEALLRAVLQADGENIGVSENSVLQGNKTIVTENAASIITENRGSIENALNNTEQLAGDGTVVQSGDNTISSLNMDSIKNMTTEQLFKEIFAQLASTNGDKASMIKLLQSDSFKASINEFLQKQLLLKPEASDKEHVQEMYNRLGKQLNNISEALQSIGQENSPLGKTVQNMNQNVQFLNQLNNMYAYIQLPLKLSESNAHGELYVYSNKKHLAGTDGEISALLHLDMDHLGPLDIHVKMKESNVSTNFYLADEEMLDFLYEHMDLLTSRLEKRGYHMSYHLTVRENQEGGGNITLNELLHENSNIPTLVNYSFDVRA